MKISVITLTPGGAALAEKLARELPGEVLVYCFEKYPVPGGKSFAKTGDITREIWDSSDGIIFICACGIAVRACAPLIRSKITDPAVTAVDEQGRFAVSLLSGHIGGANDLARRAAGILGAVPVITTATDICGGFSPDMFAKENNLVITDMTLAKEIAAASVRGERIGFEDALSGCVINPQADYGICVSRDKSRTPFRHTLALLPKNIAAGVGCRKGLPPETLEKHMLSCFAAAGISPMRICALATIDIKRNEPAVTQLAQKYGVPLKIFSAEELSRAKGNFSSSDFVKKATGTDNVCERSAALCGGSIIMPKTKGEGVTCALGEIPVSIPVPENL